AYLGARWTFGKRGPALACATLASFYGPFLFYEGLLLGATLAVFFIWSFLASAALARKKESLILWCIPGLALGAAGLARPTLLAAVVPVTIWLLLRRRGTPVLKRLGTAALFGSFACLPLLPSLVHNIRHGAVQPVALHGGINFYIGNRAGSQGGYERPFPGPHGLLGQRRAAKREAQRRLGRTLDWAEVDRFWFREGTTQAASNPTAWFRVMGRKALLLLNSYEVPLDYSLEFHRTRSPVHALPLPAFAWILPLAAGGLFLLVRDKKTDWPALLLFVSGGFATLLFFVTARYRLPLAPPLILLAGYGLFEGVGALLRARLTRFAMAGAMASLAGFLVLVPVDRTDHSGSWRLLGDALQKGGEFAQALKAYDESIAVAPSSAAWNNKGNTLLKFRGPEKAIEAFEEAIRLEEGNREAWNNLGVALKRMEDYLGAEDVFETTIARFPGYKKPILNLARMYEELGDPGAADRVRRTWLSPGDD
ncbi:MAG: tetratricopeptide repeat protein, partial [Planctomycetota bacterium]